MVTAVSMGMGDDGRVPPRVEVRLFGLFGLYADGVAVPLKPQAKRLLALLAVRLNEPVSRAVIIEAIWDGGQPDVKNVANQVQVHIGAIRKALARAGVIPEAVAFAGAGRYRLLSPPVDCDLDQFDRTVAAAHETLGAGLIAQASQLLSRALRIASGVALDGVDGVLAEGESARLEERKLAVLSDRIDTDLWCERYIDLVPELKKLTGVRRADDRFRIRLMLALHASGRTAEALTVFRAGRKIAHEEQGLEPGQALQAVHQAILTGAPVHELLSRFAPLPYGDSPAMDRSAAGVSRGPLPPSTALAGTGLAALGTRYSPPPDTAAFTGRDEELGQITAAADAAGAGRVVTVYTIGGMPGIGKTALAVHAAHRLRHRFPDRQLFIDLHAHTPGREPMAPEDALAGLLMATGLEPRFLPEDLEARAGVWRDRMAGQRALLVLDNAAGSDQVAPLLPAGRDCLVLVTSRRHLGDLPGVVAPVLLGALPPQQAVEMFTWLAPRAACFPAEIAEVVALAGFLPLAVSLLARVFARHPSWTLADLAAEARAGPLTLAAERDSVAAAFEVSYRHLHPAQQRMFRLLGVHPGGTTDAYAAAALAAISLDEAARLLDELHGEGLVTETGYRRYGMHDLLRRYAHDQIAASTAADEGQQALERLLDYYQHTAARADARLARQTRPGPRPATPPAGPPAAPDLDGTGQALAWMRAERASLLACLDHATRTGQHTRVIALTAALAGLLRRDGPWADAIIRHTTAVHAAHRLGDRLGQANALHNLGDLRQRMGDSPGAAHDLEQALRTFHDLGDRLGQASTRHRLGVVRQRMGDYPGAFQDLEQALNTYRDLGDPGGEAEALNQTGTLHRVSGDPARAQECHQQALEVARSIASPWDEAHALAGLGRCATATGNPAHAEALLRQALEIFQRTSAADAPGLLAELNALTGPPLGEEVRQATG